MKRYRLKRQWRAVALLILLTSLVFLTVRAYQIRCEQVNGQKARSIKIIKK